MKEESSERSKQRTNRARMEPQQDIPSPLKIDPFEVRIQEEVEEFLRDLTLEYPFPEVFETLRRCEYKDRYGAKVVPFPRAQRLRHESHLRDIELRIGDFLEQLRADFGENYKPFIQESFRFYTQTTVD